MAEGKETRSLKELEDEITCSICKEHYSDPKVLPCLHYYCKQCIFRLIRRLPKEDKLHCPECREETPLTEQGVDQLKTAFFINRLKAMVSTLEKAFGKVEIKCETCTGSEGQSKAFCRQCAAFVCDECVKLHHKMKTLNTHEITPLDQLNQGKLKDIILESPIAACQVHDEPLIIFCFDCDTLICQHCTVKHHRDHNFEFSRVAAGDIKTRIMQQLRPLTEEMCSISKALEDIQDVKKEVEAQGKSVNHAIQASFQELHKILDQHEKKLVEEAQERTEKKMDTLLVQEKDLSLAKSEIHSIVDYTEQCMKHSTDNEVMITHKEVSKKIEEKIQNFSDSKSTKEPQVEPDLGIHVECADALQRLCQNRAHLVQLPVNLPESIADMEYSKKATVYQNCTATFTFGARIANKRAKRTYKLTAHLKSLCSDVLTECVVSITSGDHYSVSYMPTVRGRHRLIVKVDGQQSGFISFPLFVSIDPVHLSQPLTIWDGFSSPSGIAINSADDILVTELMGNIVKFSPDGQRVTLVTSMQHDLTNLRSLALDKYDNIYCIDSKNSRILKCDKNGEDLRVCDIQQVTGAGFYGVTVVEDEVIMCERSNSGLVVCNRDLQYIRSIKNDIMGQLLDVAADNFDNLFVTDTTNKCVHVLSKDGMHLHSFGGNEAKKLNIPWGICVCGSTVYVTDTSNGSVNVYSTEGNFVTSFGRYGNKAGDFRGPYYVCVDRDEFIYVTDNSNNRIQCF